MLNSGFDINGFVRVLGVPEYLTVIQIASLCSEEDVVRFIIERGANVNNRSTYSSTALHFAARLIILLAL
jgi:hypothetical protein